MWFRRNSVWFHCICLIWLNLRTSSWAVDDKSLNVCFVLRLVYTIWGEEEDDHHTPFTFLWCDFPEKRRLKNAVLLFVRENSRGEENNVATWRSCLFLAVCEVKLLKKAAASVTSEGRTPGEEKEEEWTGGRVREGCLREGERFWVTNCQRICRPPGWPLRAPSMHQAQLDWIQEPSKPSETHSPETSNVTQLNLNLTPQFTLHFLTPHKIIHYFLLYEDFYCVYWHTKYICKFWIIHNGY